MKRIVVVIQIVIVSAMLLSCEKDPSFENGYYLFENGVMNEAERVGLIFLSWKDVSLPDSVKNAIREIASAMVLVEGDTYTMGDYDYESESPAHEVSLSDYWISAITVTQKQWCAIMGENQMWHSAYGKGDDYPANYVSYDQALLFVQRLNSYAGTHFRLPTEAEWEFAALGGKRSQGYIYSGSSNIDEVAWYNGNTSGSMLPVGWKVPNELGLYDMSGNVCEWCSDWYGTYSGETVTNPAGPTNGTKRVVRGGNFTLNANYARCKARNALTPNNQSLAVGVRLVMDVQ